MRYKLGDPLLPNSLEFGREPYEEDARDILVESGYCPSCNASADEVDDDECSRCGTQIRRENEK